MTVTAADRQRWRASWRQLTQAAIQACTAPAAEASDLRGLARASSDWVFPSEDKAEGLVCAALAWSARAFAELGSGVRRAPMVPALAALAAQVGDILDASDPRPPGLPFRADLDG